MLVQYLSKKTKGFCVESLNTSANYVRYDSGRTDFHGDKNKEIYGKSLVAEEMKLNFLNYSEFFLYVNR